MATTPKTTWRGWLVAILFGATVLAGGAAAVMTLHARSAASDQIAPRPALAVQTAVLQRLDRIDIRESFVGRIEPARETLPAAERSGLIVDILVEEGDSVADGQILARLDLRPLEIERTRLMAERTSLDADIELAAKTTERRAKLVGDGWASGQAHDEARFSGTALKARRDAIDAAIAQLDLDLEKSLIRAPYAGKVAARMVDEGAVVAAGTALIRIQEARRPQARVGIPSDRAGELGAGSAVSLEYQGNPIKGRVVAVTLDLEPGTRTVPVLIDLATDLPLVMGQVVRLHLTRQIDMAGAWIDLSALTEAERGLWSIQTVISDNGQEAVQREVVEILHVEGERAFVRGTFPDGARVIPVGAHKLSNGQAVTTGLDG